MCKGPPRWRSQRYILAYFLLVGEMNIVLQKTDINLGIVCMVNHTAVYYHNDTANKPDQSISSRGIAGVDTSSSSLPSKLLRASKMNDNATSIHDESLFYQNVLRAVDNNSSKHQEKQGQCQAVQETNEKEDGPFVWDKATVGAILSASNWAMIGLVLPVGYVIDNLNKKYVVSCAQLAISMLSLCIPTAAWLSPWAVFTIKLVQGACFAIMTFAIFGLLTRWAPAHEISTLMSFFIQGATIGKCLVFPLSAALCESGYLGGWSAVFYIPGCLGLFWLILFLAFTTESPESHMFISLEERNYLRETVQNSGKSSTSRRSYTDMLKSPAFWAVTCVACSFHWGNAMSHTLLPQYAKDVLKAPILSNGLWTMLPFVALGIATPVTGPLSDLCVNRKWVSKFWIQRLYIVIGNTTPAVLIIAISYMDCLQTPLVITSLVIATGCTALTQSAYNVNLYDIGQDKAAHVRSLMMVFSCMPGAVAPHVVGAITVHGTREEWQYPFYIASGFYLSAAGIFCILSKQDVQFGTTDLPIDISLNEISNCDDTQRS